MIKADSYPCFTLGVTGGIASGKSLVAEMLEKMGALTIDMDVLARQVVQPGKPALQAVVDAFGTGVLTKDGTLDRKAVSRIVFQDPEKRKKLERLIHPAIFQEYERKLEELCHKSPGAVIQVVVPLLFEAGLEGWFDRILLVYASAEKQIERLTRRDEIDDEEARRILSAQLPIDEKIGRSHFVIRNEGTPEETRAQVEESWAELNDRSSV